MADSTGLRLYQSHKTVHAAKILGVSGEDITLDAPTGPMVVKAAKNMFARYVPVPGDFYVIYRDGFASISPSQEFIDGYHPI